MTAHQLEAGYRRAYRDFYRWGSILRSASVHNEAKGLMRHVLYAGGWKKFESSWDFVIRAGKVSRMLPLLERILGMSGGAGAPTMGRPPLPRMARGRADR
jgi:hypothetical protein